MHPEDVEKVKKFSDFTRVVVNRDVMIAHINQYYLFDSKEKIVPGVLMSENLVDTIKSDYKFDCVEGPIRYRGQDSFISMFCQVRVFRDTFINQHSENHEKQVNASAKQAKSPEDECQVPIRGLSISKFFQINRQ